MAIGVMADITGLGFLDPIMGALGGRAQGGCGRRCGDNAETLTI